jgi:uncharacterized membrane protein YfcA
MEWSLVGLFLVVGIFVGLAAGFFGIGGGLIAIPIFLWIFEVRNIGGENFVQLAFGTNLFIIIFTSAFASYRHTKNNLVVWQAVPYIAISSIIGALAGSQLAGVLSGNILKYIFILFLIYAAARLLVVKKAEDFNKTNIVDLKDKKRLLLLIGILSGFISGLTGLGGGIVAIPLMISLLNIPIKSVAGTSSSIMIFTALAATSGYILSGWNNPDLPIDSMGYVYFFAAVPVLFSSVVFVQVGAYLNIQISPNKLRYIFVMFLFMMSLKILLF